MSTFFVICADQDAMSSAASELGFVFVVEAPDADSARAAAPCGQGGVGAVAAIRDLDTLLSMAADRPDYVVVT